MVRKTQTGRKTRKTLSTLIFSGLLLVVFLSLFAFAPGSKATRQTQNPAAPQNLNTEKRRRPEFVPGDVLVRFKKNQAFEGTTSVAVPIENVASASESRTSRSTGLAAPQEYILARIDRFEGSDLIDGLRIARVPATDTLKAVAALRARDDVLYAEPNYIRYLDRTPNDPRWLSNELYGLSKIAAPQAWDTTIGSSNIVAGVIDEGIDISHPDLQPNIWTNPSPGSIPGITGDLHGYNFRDNTGTFPAETHATHVAGTIGAVGDNNQGVVGVNWQVRLMSLRFISESISPPGGSDADALRAYAYAKQMRDLWVSSGGTQGANIRALNASYGGGGYSQSASDAINALGQSGILFVAAAGNDGTDNDVLPHYPSGYSLPNVIAVTATTSSDAQQYNFGLHSVMMGAPGVGILSTYPAPTNYAFASGTSMATPHVTGAAALLCAANPNLTVAQLRALLAFNGDIIPSLQGKTLTGRRLNVFKSLQAITENDTTPPGKVSNLGLTSQNGRALNLSWTASGDDGAAGQAALYDVSFVDQFTGAVVPLIPVAAAPSGSQQTLSVNIPYRHTAGKIQLREFDNLGNEGTPATLPVTVDRNLSDPYATSLSAPAGLSFGGTPQGLTFDDCYKENYALPPGFSFPFFGTSYTTVTISTNGNLFFSPPPKRNNPDCTGNGIADDVPSSVNDLSRYKMISGMWDDLDLRTSQRADADVYVVTPDSTHVIFRWQGVQFGTGAPVNFEIELNSNGTVKTRYGSGNTNLFPVVGISGGEPDAYVATALTSELTPINLTNAQSAVFTPRALVPLPTVQFSQPSVTVNESAGNVLVTVTRTGDTTSSSSINYATADSAGSQNCNVVNGAASSRCDYETTTGTLQFGPGDTSKTFTIALIDDTFAEGDENLTVNLSGGSGASLGAQSTITITIHDVDASGGVTPIGATDFFVRQQYLDFLNREPDTPGFNFWRNNINSCGAVQSCIDVKRIDTSAAFFLSIEFQQTGYLVERLYKTAYGDADGTSIIGGSHQLKVPVVRFLSEFLPDTQKIGQGVVVNVGNWQQQLEENKLAFTDEFVQRTRFTTAFPLSLTAAQFVDQLNTNAQDINGVKPLSQAERDQLVSQLSGGIKTRAQVLRAVAEDADLNTSEFNRAFVLMQYFGYLRRNPNDAPESTLDYSGYDFWLTKLNQFTVPGDDVLVRVQKADMVKSFIVSGEYIHRFGS